MTDSAGIRIAESHEPVWNNGAAWSVPATPRLSIGVLDGPPEYQLSNISAAARQADGDLVVADAGAGTVRLYSAQGAFKRLLGGPGPGPGEFVNPSQILIGATDSVHVWDDAGYRVTSFDAAGAFVRVHTIGRESIAKAIAPPLYPGTAQLLSDGSLLVRLIEKTKELPAESPFRGPSGALHVSFDPLVIDTLTFFGDVEQAVLETPLGRFAVESVLPRNTSIAVQPTEPRTCLGDQNGPQVLCFEPGAAPLAVRWSAEPVPVREDDPAVAAWREATLDLYTQKLSRQDAERLIAQIPIPAQRPAYVGLALDHEGNLWVARSPPTNAASDATEYLVFDREGVLLGSLSLPSVRILEIGGDYLIGVHEDEVEVQYLQLFDIVKRP